MDKMGGYAGTILSVDLSNHAVEKIPLNPVLAKDFIGGHGINAKLLYDPVKPRDRSACSREGRKITVQVISAQTIHL